MTVSELAELLRVRELAELLRVRESEGLGDREVWFISARSEDERVDGYSVFGDDDERLWLW